MVGLLFGWFAFGCFTFGWFGFGFSFRTDNAIFLGIYFALLLLFEWIFGSACCCLLTSKILNLKLIFVIL